jgi:hypothetical protein
MGARRAWQLAPDQGSGVTIMDRYFGEVKIEVPKAYAPGGKAALASSRGKAVFVVACILLGGYLYNVQERKHAAAASAAQALPREMRQTLSHLSPRDDPAALHIRKVFYDKEDGVVCGEVDGRKRHAGQPGAQGEVRVFVCGPALATQASR